MNVNRTMKSIDKGDNHLVSINAAKFNADEIRRSKTYNKIEKIILF